MDTRQNNLSNKERAAALEAKLALLEARLAALEREFAALKEFIPIPG